MVASVVVFFGVSSIGDPLGQLRLEPSISAEALQRYVDRKHLDRPLLVQYGLWVKEAVTNQFGTDLLRDREIWPDLVKAMGRTSQLVLPAEAIAVLFAAIVGVTSARFRYSVFDHGFTLLSFLAYSLPTFWLALVLQVAVTSFYNSSGIRLFYTAGLSSPNPGTGLSFFIDRLQHLALPIFVLSVTSVAVYSRYMRSSMLDQLGSEYVRLARSKGVRERRVLTAHAFRNALLPFVTVIGAHLGAVLGGTIIVETIFDIPGMGTYFYNALIARDVYPLMAWLMVTSTLIVVFNLVTDLVYAVIDPRIRYE